MVKTKSKSLLAACCFCGLPVLQITITGLSADMATITNKRTNIPGVAITSFDADMPVGRLRHHPTCITG
jgi:hypothetical protein